MSDGIDVCSAAKRDIREMREEFRSAEKHFQRAKGQFDDAKNALANGNYVDAWHHIRERAAEQKRGDDDLAKADQHHTESLKHMAKCPEVIKEPEGLKYQPLQKTMDLIR